MCDNKDVIIVIIKTTCDVGAHLNGCLLAEAALKCLCAPSPLFRLVCAVLKRWCLDPLVLKQ